MDMQKKLSIVETAIRSVSEHRDEDVAVRGAALDRIDAFVVTQREMMEAEVKARIAESFKG